VPVELIRLFSKRRVQIDAAAAGLIAEKQALLGRSITGDERAAILQLAAYRSRAAKKDGGETTEEVRARWGPKPPLPATHPNDGLASCPAGRCHPSTRYGWRGWGCDHRSSCL
jgi:hypothetical protein